MRSTKGRGRHGEEIKKTRPEVGERKRTVLVKKPSYEESYRRKTTDKRPGKKVERGKKKKKRAEKGGVLGLPERGALGAR